MGNRTAAGRSWLDPHKLDSVSAGPLANRPLQLHQFESYISTVEKELSFESKMSHAGSILFLDTVEPDVSIILKTAKLM